MCTSWKKIQRSLTSIIIGCSLFATLGAGCGQTSQKPGSAEKVTLTYWRVFDGDDAFDEIVSAYEALHPYVTIDYRVLRYDEYESALLRSLAKGEGPDMFTVHNTHIGEYRDLLLPMPASVTVKTLETVGSLRKETVLSEKKTTMPSLRSIRENFVDVVGQDVIFSETDDSGKEEERVYGLPLALDTLALYYDKDLFNAAGIAEPPATWSDVSDVVKKMTTYDDKGEVVQSALGMGTGENVERSADIMQVLMMQNGTHMVDDRQRVAFHEIPDTIADGVYPGLDAVRFYTDFANPVKDTYTWNDTYPRNLEAFASGSTAMFLGYSYHAPLIKALAPGKNIGIAKLPQIGSGAKEVNIANYWVEGVSRSSKHHDEAWDFLAFATSQDHVLSYLQETQKPTALRALIDDQIEDPVLNPFVSQVLTSQSWYHGNDADAMEEAFIQLAEMVLSGNRKAEDAIQNAAKIVAQTYK